MPLSENCWATCQCRLFLLLQFQHKYIHDSNCARPLSALKVLFFITYPFYIFFLFMKSSINCKTTHDNRNAATDRILTPVADNANESLEAEGKAVLTQLYPWVCFDTSWRDPDFNVFLPILISTTIRHFNSIYRSKRVMLMSSWPVKNILLLENILASALEANWALWQCNAWLVHINTKGWKIQFCSLFRRALQGEGTKKIKKKRKNHQDWCWLRIWPGDYPNVFYWLCRTETRN